MTRRTALLWLAVTVWWTLHGLVTAADVRTMRDAAGHPVAWSHALSTGLASAWLWVPITMGLIWLVRRSPFERGRMWRALGSSAMAVAAILLLRATVVMLLNDWIGWYERVPSFRALMVTSVVNNFFMSWLIIGVAHAILFAERARQRERQAMELQGRLAEARLAALSAQLNPHFLFNALNTIAELVHQDQEAADRMLVGLSALLRRSLETGGLQLVPLGDELQVLDHYVDLERIRLGARLRVHWQIDPSLRATAVPPLVLQPLVENAIRHAVSRRATPGQVSISARHDADRLVLEVSDDGDDRAGAMQGWAGFGSGVGLANTRARLECLYGAAHELDVLCDPGGGTTVRLRIPLSQQHTRTGAGAHS